MLAVGEPGGRIVKANRAAAALLGYPSPQDLAGLAVSDLLSDDAVCRPNPRPGGALVLVRTVDGPRTFLVWSWRADSAAGRAPVLYMALAEDPAPSAKERELRRRLALQEILTGLSLSLLPDDARPRLGETFAAFGRALAVDRLFLCTFKGESRRLSGNYSWQARGVPAAGAPVAVDEAWSAALRAGEPVIVPRAADLPPPIREEQARRGVASFLLVPGTSIKGNRSLLAVEDCHEPRAWEGMEVEAAGVFARLASAAVDRWQEKEDLRRLASQDALTGLANRHAFERRLKEIDGRPAFYPVSLLIGDVDGLKAVNDRLGHQAGDRLLRKTGYVLRRALRRDDTIARLGGDEFGVIMVATPPRSAQAIQARLEEVLSDYAALGLRVSIGVATATKPGQPLAPLLRLADRRMYEAKRAADRGVNAVP